MNSVKMVFALMLLCIALPSISLNAEDSVLESGFKKYANKKQPCKNSEVKSFKFVSLAGESTATNSDSEKAKKSVDNGFKSIGAALTLLRDPDEKSKGTIVGNRETGQAFIVEGVLCVTFLEIAPAGVVHTLTITDCWDEKRGGFVAVYTRVVSFENGVKYSVVNSTFNGLAIPWD